MTREENLANYLFDKFELSLPVPIKRLTRNFADLEFTDLPAGLDGLKIPAESRAGHHTKPLVLIKNELPKTRMRFTIAHELAHVVLPWHINAEITIDNKTSIYGSETPEFEKEANRFASELLAPTTWVRQQWTRTEDFLKYWDCLQVAGLSGEATLISSLKALPPGYHIGKLDPERRLIRKWKSAGTEVPWPSLDYVPVDGSIYEKLGVNFFEFKCNSTSYVCWRYGGGSETRATSQPSQEILGEILGEVSAGASAQSIAGIIGAANSRIRTAISCQELFDYLKNVFSNRPDIETVVSHPKFIQFLSNKANELHKRRSFA